ncbi:MAG: PEP-CTERM sorting domain-containing protein [Phycisphaerales bacterium]
MLRQREIARVAGAAAIGALGVSTSMAPADIVASFGFTELTSSFTFDEGAGDGLFIADGNLDTTGDVTRLLPVGNTALYNPGTIDNSPAAVHFQISVFNINSVAKTADGLGSFSIVDADGDVLLGSFSGSWSGAGFGFTFYAGTGVDYSFDSSNGNGTFDGPSGGSFSTDFGVENLIGAVSLLFQQPNMGFFTSSFARVSAQADGVMILPAPGTMALSGLGLGILGVRRRRR